MDARTPYPIGRDDIAFAHNIVRGVLVRLGWPPALQRDDLDGYAMVGLVEAAKRYDPTRNDSFRGYAFPRVRGAIFDGLRCMGWLPRREYARAKGNAETVERPAFASPAGPPSPEMGAALSEVLARLSPRDAEIVRRVDCDGQSLRTAAAALGCSAATACRARNRFLSELWEAAGAMPAMEETMGKVLPLRPAAPAPRSPALPTATATALPPPASWADYLARKYGSVEAAPRDVRPRPTAPVPPPAPSCPDCGDLGGRTVRLYPQLPPTWIPCEACQPAAVAA